MQLTQPDRSDQFFSNACPAKPRAGWHSLGQWPTRRGMCTSLHVKYVHLLKRQIFHSFASASWRGADLVRIPAKNALSSRVILAEYDLLAQKKT